MHQLLSGTFWRVDAAVGFEAGEMALNRDEGFHGHGGK